MAASLRRSASASDSSRASRDSRIARLPRELLAVERAREHRRQHRGHARGDVLRRAAALEEEPADVPRAGVEVVGAPPGIGTAARAELDPAALGAEQLPARAAISRSSASTLGRSSRSREISAAKAASARRCSLSAAWRRSRVASSLTTTAVNR